MRNYIQPFAPSNLEKLLHILKDLIMMAAGLSRFELSSE
jgi:hypothetical protein